MGKKGKQQKGGQKQKGENMISVDPARIRFQHSRIRPYFSGCGRHLDETLDAIRSGTMNAEDLPPIQVLLGPETDDGPWYFSLNNRRLWVLKRCREEGLLKDNEIAVRIRSPKSASEAARYSVENCALEAKIIREQPKEKSSSDDHDGSGDKEHIPGTHCGNLSTDSKAEEKIPE